jgi:hypothetical protein
MNTRSSKSAAAAAFAGVRGGVSAAADQQDGDADLQEDPDDNDDVAVDEYRHQVVLRPVVRADDIEAVDLARARGGGLVT